MRHLSWLLAMSGLAACTGPEDTGELVVELQGPTLEHTTPESSLESGGSVLLEVTASDPEGVRVVTLYHRTLENTYWESSPLEASDGTWFVDLEELEAPGLEYYFKATDDGETPATSYLPEEATAEPYQVEVLALAVALPWVEDFELLPEETSLFTMDWWSPTEAFTGYPWELTLSDYYSGESSAVHQRGSEAVGELSDWLVSPALDFSTLDEIMVRWMERGASVDSMGTHGLYISAGSRDVSDGGFEAVEASLPSPEESWARSESYDLSAWAGEPVVYLAWHYQGEAADDWYIDDVEVLELAADLQASLAWAPDPVHPGETASITVAIDNHTAAEATDVVGTLSLPEGGATVAEPEVSIDLIEGDGTQDLSFSLDLDSDLEDNRALPLLLELTDGQDTWEFELEMIVGLPSEASIRVYLLEDASLQWLIGVGDPEEPSWVTTGHAGLVEAGDQTLTLDITDAYAYLAPEAGPLRWFSQVSADVDGTVEEFRIVYGGEDYISRTGSFQVDEPGTVYIPEPPDPVLSSLSPSSAEPGESDLSLVIALKNEGEDTSGSVSGIITSLDDGVSVTSGDEFTVTSGVWGENQTAVITGPVVAISESHNDSTPVELALELTDGVEDWTVEVELDVPWPLLKISYIEIDDSGGDGILDAGESASLELEVTNTGGMSTFSTVTGVLSIETSSTATASLAEDEGYFGSLSVGSSRDDDDFELSVTSGAAGDTLDLLLTLTDGTATYEARTQIVLGEPPWQTLDGTDDDIGDVLDDYPFDIVNAQYRVIEGTVQLVLESAGSYDSSTLFLEAWGAASGADYIYYRWVLQAGSATIQGYDSSSGFEVIGTLDVDFLDDTHVMLSWLVEDMGLFSDEFSMGLAAGWCGPDAYYCDHFPDGWGYPYVSFSTSSWFDIEW